jgi:polyisoprenoid-binding protein YceI
MMSAGGALARAPVRALLALAACGILAQPDDAKAGPEVFRIEPGESRAEFTVNHFWVTTLHGRFVRAHGTIVLDSEGRNGSIDFAIDADSVDTGWSVRDDFIRSELMFDVSRFPEVRFRSTQLVFDRTGLIGASGDLTMHNVTRPVAVKVERMDCRHETATADRCGVAVISTVKRSDFGMSFALPFVGDDIDLAFQITARRVAP